MITENTLAGLLPPIEDLYNRGLMPDAWELARAIGPLAEWPGRAGRQLAGRLAGQLGNPALSRVLFHRNHRAHPAEPDAAAYASMGVMERRGPLEAWQFLQRVPEPSEQAAAPARIHLLTCRMVVHAAFRDFEQAWAFLERARAIDPGDRWLAVQESHLLEREDRYEEALAAARRSLAAFPWYRPGIQATSHLLRVLDRDDEALALLREAHAHTRHAAICSALASLELELGRVAEALAHWDEVPALVPLARKDLAQSLVGFRLACACRLRDTPRVREWAALSTEPRHQAMVDRLDRPEPEVRRVELDVRFVRQHHLTCAPATLSALAGYWGRPAAHLELVERMCLDGTPSHSQRTWAEESGFVAREFTVDWDSARALCDRGIPFAVTSSEINSGHLQAAIGYDGLRRSLLIRDPFHYGTTEALCPEFFDHYASTGPRALLFLPADQAHRLDGVSLPDAPLYDALHALMEALDHHDRPAAGAVLAQLEAGQPGHRLTWTAARALAAYDHNGLSLSRGVEGLLRLYPDDPHLLLSRLHLLRENGTAAERLAFLEQRVARPACDPLFRVKLAEELRGDARQHPRALALARDGVRRRPTDPDALLPLAHLHWDGGRFDLALQVYRLCACLARERESCVTPYFFASAARGRGEPALDFLRARQRKLGGRSAAPTQTLVTALEHLDRVDQAMAVLATALEQRPTDGALLLCAADLHARFGRTDGAKALLARAEGCARRVDVLRARAQQASYAGESAAAFAHWREVLSLEPLALDAHRACFTLRRILEGQDAAARALEQACAAHPFACGLLRLRAEMLSDLGPGQCLAAVDALLALEPDDAWARRERAVQLMRLSRLPEALGEAEHARALAPLGDAGCFILGHARLRLGRREEARADFRDALERNPDHEAALHALLSCSPGLDAKREDLLFAAANLETRPCQGDGWLSFQHLSRGVLPPEEVLHRLRAAHQARPDLWAIRAALARQLQDGRQDREALRVLEAAIEAFPLLPRLWWERAQAHRRLDEVDESIQALIRALAINPGYAEAAQTLVDQWINRNQLSEALAVMETACTRAPLNAFNHGVAADLLRRLGSKDKAYQRLRLALRLNPDYPWAWHALAAWGAQDGTPGRDRGLAEELAAERPGDASIRVRLSRILAPTDPERAHECVEQALALRPDCEEAVDLQALLLWQRHDPEAARARCRWPADGPRRPSLWLREAWIERQLGRLDAELEVLRACARANPLHQPAWQALSDSLIEARLIPEALEAVNTLSLLDPQSPLPHAQRGDLLQADKRFAEAAAAYREALRIDPAFPNAGIPLLNLLLKHGPLGEVPEVMETLRPHVGEDVLAQASVRLRLARQQQAEAEGAFRSLCHQARAEPWTLHAACEAFQLAGKPRRAADLLRETALEGAANPSLGYFWLDLQPTEESRSFEHARALLDLPAQRVQALARYLDLIGERAVPSPGATLDQVMAAYRADLTGSDHLWGKTGYALTSLGRDEDTRKWCADWQNRSGLEGWMLYNLALAFEAGGDAKAALEASRAGLLLPMNKAMRNNFLTCAALREALDGDPEEALRLHGQVDPALLPQNSFDASVHRMNRVLAAAMRRTPQPEFLDAVGRMNPAACSKDARLAPLCRRVLLAVEARHGRRVPLQHQPISIHPWFIGFLLFLAVKILISLLQGGG